MPVNQAEQGGYWGQCIEIPGAISQGETLDKKDYKIHEAIELILQVLIEDGQDISAVSPLELDEAAEPGPHWQIDVQEQALKSAS